ncbi:MAG: hypothetical protein H5T82_00400, partial [Demequina sp.]|nr:hypothetical protein [Demequina sp.]
RLLAFTLLAAVVIVGSAAVYLRGFGRIAMGDDPVPRRRASRELQSRGAPISASTMPRSKVPFRFPQGEPNPLPATFIYGGTTTNVDELLAETDTRALLVLKDGKVRFERSCQTGGPDVLGGLAAWLAIERLFRYDYLIVYFAFVPATSLLFALVHQVWRGSRPVAGALAILAGAERRSGSPSRSPRTSWCAGKVAESVGRRAPCPSLSSSEGTMASCASGPRELGGITKFQPSVSAVRARKLSRSAYASYGARGNSGWVVLEVPRPGGQGGVLIFAVVNSREPQVRALLRRAVIEMEWAGRGKNLS